MNRHTLIITLLVQIVPYITFEVTDFDYELANRDFKVITEPNLPANGIRMAPLVAIR